MDPSLFVGLMASAVAAMFGLMVKLQNDRITDRDQQVIKLELDKTQLTVELQATAVKIEQIIKTEQDATRQELAELRKTNAALVSSLSIRGGT